MTGSSARAAAGSGEPDEVHGASEVAAAPPTQLADTSKLARELLRQLRAHGWSLATAESLTGGMLSAAMVEIPGVSDTLRGAVVAYDTSVKRTLLGVDRALLAEHGPVHPEVAMQMARGVRDALSVAGESADVGISTTGIAGPDSSDGQPVGTIHIAVAAPGRATVVSDVLEGDRAQIRRETVRRALDAAIEVVSDGGGSVSAA